MLLKELPKNILQIFVFLVLLSLTSFIQAQNIHKQFSQEDIDSLKLHTSKSEFRSRKKIPPRFETQVLTALSYFPELKNAKIVFRVNKQSAPLSARSTIFGIFRKGDRRKYVVGISSKTKDRLSTILLDSLSFNAQVGVLGHELSHVSDFSKKSGFGIIGHVFKSMSKKYVDRFENNTDRISIDHGLGYQLLAWSSEVRQKLNIPETTENYPGRQNDLPRERYMSPHTIRHIIANHPFYQ